MSCTQVVNFTSRYTREQNAVDEWCVEIIKLTKNVTVACQHSLDENYLNRGFLKLG